MAFRMMEGWDMYGTADNVVIGNWTEVIGTPTISLTGGKANGRHVVMNSTADICRLDIINVSNPNSLIHGFQFKTDAAGAGTFIRWTNGLNTNIEIATLRLTASGAIEFRDGSGPSLLGSSPVDTILPGIWYTIEIKITPSVNSFGLPTATGFVELRVNGTIRIGPSSNLSIGSATQGNTSFGKVELRGDSDGYHFDDCYFYDSLGALNNDFAGDFSIQTLRPATDTLTVDWVPVNAGAHYVEVDDAQPDGDATYVSSQTPSDADIYELTDLTGDVGAILGIGPITYARRESGSTQNIASRLIGASETVDFGSKNLAEAYEVRADVRGSSVDDLTGTVPPTISEVNALQAGVFIP